MVTSCRRALSPAVMALSLTAGMPLKTRPWSVHSGHEQGHRSWPLGSEERERGVSPRGALVSVAQAHSGLGSPHMSVWFPSTHTHSHTCRHILPHTHTHTCRHIHTHSYTQTYALIHIRTHMQAHPPTRACTPTHMRTHVHLCTRTGTNVSPGSCARWQVGGEARIQMLGEHQACIGPFEKMRCRGAHLYSRAPPDGPVAVRGCRALGAPALCWASLTQERIQSKVECGLGLCCTLQPSQRALHRAPARDAEGLGP